MTARLLLFAVLVGSIVASEARAITFVDTTLGNGSFAWTVVGLTMTASTADGSLGSIGAGVFAGLWIGQDVSASGTYTLAFSQSVLSVEIEVDALSSNTSPVETMGTFAVSAGSIVLDYVNQLSTTFDGSTIAVVFPASDGQAIITIGSSQPFSSLSFVHAQNPTNSGMVIERVDVAVPEPASALLLGGGLAILAARSRRPQLVVSDPAGAHATS